MSHPFSIMLLDTQSLHLGVAEHAVLSFLALMLDCLHIAAAAGLGSSFPGSGLAAGTFLQCWHLSAVLALLGFFVCFLDSYESSMSLLYSSPMFFFILLMPLLTLSPFSPTLLLDLLHSPKLE